MNQTRLGSLIEACFNTAIGFVTNLSANMVIYPAFGWYPTLSQNLALTCLYTVVSVIRSYLVRRFFNARLHAMAQHLAKAVRE